MDAVALRLPLTPYYPAPAKQAGAFAAVFPNHLHLFHVKRLYPPPFGATFHVKRLCPPPPLEQRFT